jgi:hypothetical protein
LIVDSELVTIPPFESIHRLYWLRFFSA